MRHLHICPVVEDCQSEDVCGHAWEYAEPYESAYLADLQELLDDPQRVLETVTCPACLVRADEILEKGKL